MSMTRRAFGGLAAAGAALGGVAPRSLQEAFGKGANPVKGAAPYVNFKSFSETFEPSQPKMPRSQAVKLALMDPDLRREMIAKLFAKHREVGQIDADIQCLKALSPMAKVTFQRQRNVEREIQMWSEESILGLGGAIEKFIQRAMWGE